MIMPTISLPNFVYVPRVFEGSVSRMVVDIECGICWSVYVFSNMQEREDWFAEHYVEVGRGVYGFNLNMSKLYPYILFCVRNNSSLGASAVIERGNVACDWFGGWYLRNEGLSVLDADIIGSDAFRHWVWGDNVLVDPNEVYLINLSYGVSIRFDYSAVYGCCFEDFSCGLSDIQFLYGERPDGAGLDTVLLSAWNFMSLCERKDEELIGDGADDW